MEYVKNNFNFPLTTSWQLLFSIPANAEITIQNDDDSAIIYIATDADDNKIIKILYPSDVWQRKRRKGYTLYIKSTVANAKYQASLYI
jgi:hypothetical protein